MAVDTSKITTAANDLSSGLTKGGTAAKALGAEIVNTINALDTRDNELESRIAALEAGGSQPPIDQHGAITGFNAANGANFNIDGTPVKCDNANKSWSLANPDQYTLRFELHSKDNWISTDGAWNDATMNSGAERDEISWSSSQYPDGSTVTMNYTLTFEPGPPNTSRWLVVTQTHATVDGPPPFGVELQEGNDRMQVKVRYKQQGQSGSTEQIVYKDSTNIQRGHAYLMKIQIKFSLTSNGFLRVWRDGTQIVNYTGPIGFAGGNTYYFKQGIYRDPAPETQVVSFSNIYVL